jgi:hypothetical protein
MLLLLLTPLPRRPIQLPLPLPLQPPPPTLLPLSPSWRCPPLPRWPLPLWQRPRRSFPFHLSFLPERYPPNECT